MNKIKFDSNHILIGVFLLITGIVLGITVSTSGTFALEGDSRASATSATSTNATSTNATSTNATSTNATSTNATSANATSTNATAANASRTDNIIYLNGFSLSTTSAKTGEKVYVNKTTTGACNSGMSLHFVGLNNKSHEFSVNVEDMNSKPYFIVPRNVLSGNYSVNLVTLIGLNSDENTFSKCLTTDDSKSSCSEFGFNITLKVENAGNKEIKLNNISLKQIEGLVGEKVDVNYTASDTLTSMRLFFESGNEAFVVNVLDLDSNPYFYIPSTVKAEEYNLVKVVIMTDDASNVINDNYNIKLTVKDNSKKTYIYNNSEITNDIIKELYDNHEVSEITVNVDNSSIISEELFKTIIGTNKKLIINTNGNQLIFNGRDIKNPKSIDVNMSTSVTDVDDNLANTVSNGIIVNFVSNGNLPGNALVRLKVTELMKERFGNDRVYVYFYDSIEKGFNLISNGITSNDGYYEFSISHNSKYVLSNVKLASNLILEKESNKVVNFRQSDTNYLLILSAGLIFILILIVIALVLKNKKGKN